MKISKKTWGLLIGLTIFGILLWQLDFSQIADKLCRIHSGLFGAAVVFMGLGQFAGYGKWRVMKQKTHKDAVVPLLRIYSSVFVTGMVTPARAGDLLASFAWPSFQGSILAWSILNRILEGGMTILLALGVLGFLFTSALSGLRWGALGVFGVLAAAGTAVIFNRPLGMKFFERLRNSLKKRADHKWVSKLMRHEAHAETQMKIFYDALDEMKKAHALSALLLFTVLARICSVTANYFLLHSLGILLGWQELLGILAVTWVSGFFAPTPNGIGIGDVLPSLFLAHLGYQDYAGSFVVMNRLLEAVITLVWLLIGFFSGRLEKAKSSA